MRAEDEVYAALTAIFRDVFMRDDLALRPDLTAHDVPGWDSARQIEILLAVEQHFGLRFSSRQIDTFDSVGALARAVTEAE